MTEDQDRFFRGVLEMLPASPSVDPAGWQEVVRRAEVSTPRRPILRRALGVGSVTVAAAVAVVIGVLAPWQGGPSFLEQAAAAVAPRDDALLYVHTRGAGVDQQVWFRHDGRFRAVATYPDGSSAENDSTGTVFDSRTNTFIENPGVRASICLLPPPEGRALDECTDPVSALSVAIEAGQARIVGEGTIRGVSVRDVRYKAYGGGSVTVSVNAATFTPVQTTFVGTNGTSGTSEFLDYQWIPSTPANSNMLSVHTMHPQAKPATPIR